MPQMYDHGGGEGALQPGAVAGAHLIVHESLSGQRHGAVDEAQDGHDAAYKLIKGIIVYSQQIEHHAGGVERHPHGEEHAAVEIHRIAGNAAVVG